MSVVGETDRGMTLLESMVVLAILGLISSLAVVQISHAMRIYSLRQAVSTVESDIKFAHSQSLRSGQPIAFAANEDGSAYGWSDKVRPLPSGVRVALQSAQPITFYPDGSSSGGTIAVANSTTQKILSIDATTGAVDAR